MSAKKKRKEEIIWADCKYLFEGIKIISVLFLSHRSSVFTIQFICVNRQFDNIDAENIQWKFPRKHKNLKRFLSLLYDFLVFLMFNVGWSLIHLLKSIMRNFEHKCGIFSYTRCCCSRQYRSRPARSRYAMCVRWSSGVKEENREIQSFCKCSKERWDAPDEPKKLAQQSKKMFIKEKAKRNIS